jgi:hypothetical protein
MRWLAVQQAIREYSCPEITPGVYWLVAVEKLEILDCPDSQSLCFGTLLSSSETRDWPPGVAFTLLASTISRALTAFP